MYTITSNSYGFILLQLKNMKIIKQYIKNNKQLIIMFFILTLFLILHNSAFCDSFFQKWYLKTENYFLNLTWEKAISDPIELSKSVGWVSIGALGSLYAFEGIWNARLLGSKFAYNYTPLGHLDDVGGNIKSWFGFRNTAGPLKYIIDTVPYEEIFPLFWARKYVFPNIFIRSNQTTVNLPPINENNNLPAIPNHSIPEPQIIEQIVEREVEKIVHVDHFFEVPVYIQKYIPVADYRDRENITDLKTKITDLTAANRDLLLVQNNFKTREEIITEINGITQFEEAITYNISKLKKNFIDYSVLLADEDRGNELSSCKLKCLEFHRSLNGVKVYFDHPSSLYVTIPLNNFKKNFPLITKLVQPIIEPFRIVERAQDDYGINIYNEELSDWVYIEVSYTTTRHSWYNTSYTFEPETSLLKISGGPIEASKISSNIGRSDDLCNLVEKIEEMQLQKITTTNLVVDNLIAEITNKIQQEERLFNTETLEQSTQTQDFGVNAAIFAHINSFLEIRDETSFIVASNRGNKLPFDAMIHSNKTLLQPVEIQTGEMSIQTDPIEENIETIDISSGVSQIIQNPAMMFAATLGILAADNLQTLETATQILLGYTSLPEYNDAFIAATHMSISELESTYNLTQQGAIRVSDLLNSAYNTMNPENNLAELSPQLTDSNSSIAKPFNWNKYLFIGASVVLVAGSAYFLWNSVKYGTPVNDWGTQYIDKIKNL